jgi:hypothetical protein
MIKIIRYALFLICAVELLLAIAFFLQWPVAVSLWPFPGTTPLTFIFIFISSLLAAAATSTLWATASQNYGALAGIGLDYMLIFTPLSLFSFQLGASRSTPPLITYSLICALVALFGLGLLLWSLRIPLDRTRPLPNLVRWSFVIFIIALLAASLPLIFKIPNVIPWKITPELSVMIGWVFFGASSYFVYGLLRPSWLNAAGQLTGFLVYDLVLIVPFVTRLATTASELRVSLLSYIAVISYSGLLAIYFLFIHKPTRLWT